ncbi:hypothetical protein ABEG18_05625 [Alsobacter sp. KACC 23698]|uniref:Uncharacterized protein n=1 Tax=Alsobacter sp. KACC 23698 TaxID=3149229 RepID=A0AAU7JIX0_9HYPH
MTTITTAIVACSLLGWFQQGLTFPAGPMEFGAPLPGFAAQSGGGNGNGNGNGNVGNGNGNGNVGNGNGNGNAGNNNGNGNVGNGNGNGFASDNNGNGPLAGAEAWWSGPAASQPECATAPGG